MAEHDRRPFRIPAIARDAAVQPLQAAASRLFALLSDRRLLRTLRRRRRPSQQTPGPHADPAPVRHPDGWRPVPPTRNLPEAPRRPGPAGRGGGATDRRVAGQGDRAPGCHADPLPRHAGGRRAPRRRRARDPRRDRLHGRWRRLPGFPRSCQDDNGNAGIGEPQRRGAARDPATDDQDLGLPALLHQRGGLNRPCRPRRSRSCARPRTRRGRGSLPAHRSRSASASASPGSAPG